MPSDASPKRRVEQVTGRPFAFELAVARETLSVIPSAASADCRIPRWCFGRFSGWRARVMRCDYSDGRSMGSTRVGVGDDSVTQLCACLRLGWSALR